MKNKLRNILTSKLFTMFSCGALIMLLLFTNPNRLPLAIILFIIVLFYVCLSLVIVQVLQAINMSKKNFISNRYILNSFFIALFPTSLLMLISINQLTLKDFLLLLVFGVLVLLYISKFKIKKS